VSSSDVLIVRVGFCDGWDGFAGRGSSGEAQARMGLVPVTKPVNRAASAGRMEVS
jgi:hypothetical protein